MRLLGAGGVVVAGAVLVLTGCQGDPAPSPPPTPSASSAAPSASPSPVAPTLPAAARGTSPAAAKAFVRYYFATINYAALSGDVSGLRSLSEPGCKSCNAIIKNITKVYGAGGYIQSENWEVRSVIVLQHEKGREVLSVGLFLHREVTIDALGKRKVGPSGRQPLTMRLHTLSHSFKVQGLEFVS
ncbi:MAG: DUF6318 family protein [Sciscionella sp.]